MTNCILDVHYDCKCCKVTINSVKFLNNTKLLQICVAIDDTHIKLVSKL